MAYKIKITGCDILPPERDLAEAAAYGITTLIIAHLRNKNGSTAGNRYGLPKTNYYATERSDIATTVVNTKATIAIDKPGLEMHYTGGTVLPRPGKKALAIPISPAVAGIWPSEAGGIATGGDYDDGPYHMFWPKGSSHGFIKETDTNELLWLLLPKAKIPADPSVLPTDDEMYAAAEDEIMELMS